MPDEAKSGMSRMVRNAMAWVLIIGSALAAYTVTAPGVFRSALRDYLRVDETRFGMLLGIGSLTGAVGAVAAGIVARKTGPVNLLKPLFLLSGIGYAMVGFSDSFVTVMLGLGLCGFGAQALCATSQGALTQLYPESCRRMLSIHTVAAASGSMLYASIVEKMLGLCAGSPSSFGLCFHAPFFLFALLLFLCAQVFRKGVVEQLAGEKTQADGAPVASRISLAAWLTIAALSIHSIADTLLYLWMPRLLEQGRYASGFKPGYVLTAYSLAYVVSRTLLALMKEQSFRRSFLSLPGVLGASMVLLGLLLGGPWTGICYIAGAFLWSAEYPSMLALLSGQVSRKSFTVCVAGVLASSGFAIAVFSTGFGKMLDAGLIGLERVLIFPAVLFVSVSVIGILQSFVFKGGYKHA